MRHCTPARALLNIMGAGGVRRLEVLTDMKTVPTLMLRGTRHTEPLEACALDQLEKLQRCCASIIGARVLVERPERHHRTGRYRVRIQLTVPGEEIVVAHDASPRASALARRGRSTRKRDDRERTHTHGVVAIRDAFAHARRQLQDYERRRRGQAKRHKPALAGALDSAVARPSGPVLVSRGRWTAPRSQRKRA